MTTLPIQAGPGHSHAVHFYSDRAAMGSHVARFLLEGLDRGETVLVVAAESTHQDTRHHLAARLPQFGTLPNYIAVDADELLSNFLVDTKPDRAHFFEVMDHILAKPSRAGRPIRVYGEMVARLCHAGLPDAALQLEELWNLLAERYQFSLLCAYPKNLFEPHDTQWFLQTCALHSHLSVVADPAPQLSTSQAD